MFHSCFFTEEALKCVSLKLAEFSDPKFYRQFGEYDVDSLYCTVKMGQETSMQMMRLGF